MSNRTVWGRSGCGCACVAAFALMFAVAPNAAPADGLPFSTQYSSNYLVITTHGAGGDAEPGGNQNAFDVNNFELGANKAPVPSTDSFLSGGGSSGGPSLFGNVPDLPLNTLPVFQGIGGKGNIAITNPGDGLNLQDVGVYADPGGIRLATGSTANNTSGNSFFHDPNSFPNTVTSTGFTHPGVNNNLGGSGTDVNPGAADASTAIDADGSPGNAGVTYDFDHSLLLSELDAARTAISTAAATGTLDLSGNGGQIQKDTTTDKIVTSGSIALTSAALNQTGVNGNNFGTYRFTVESGFNVIDVETDGNLFKLDNVNFVVDGPADAYVVFRLPGSENMLITNSNVLAGMGGIGMNNVLFFTDQTENDTHFDIQNGVVNGAAFWSLGGNGGVINHSNAQGCSQFIADIISMDDVRWNRCAFGPVSVPSPAVLPAGAALLGCVAMRRRRR